MSCENYSSQRKQEQDSSQKKHRRKYCFRYITTLMVLFIYLHFIDMLSLSEISYRRVAATSINYGISQQPITDINQLMPKLCQNQSVICEGSFCIPGVRKCVCDLRMPVQFGRFCLRQLDIETKCFVTNQCNHTVKDAVCIDINSNAILDAESSKFKLEQWQQLNQLRQQSKSATNHDIPAKQHQSQTYSTTAEPLPRSMFLIENNHHNILDRFTYDPREAVIISNVRNSPYEINYTMLDLIQQNHTRRRTNNSDRSSLNNLFTPVTSSNFNPNKETHLDDKIITTNTLPSDISSTQGSLESLNTQTETTTIKPDVMTSTHNLKNIVANANDGIKTDETTTREPIPTTTTLSHGDLTSRKKTIIKSPNWPPGVCSCPFGFMFDSMLRKCLALSLADSHCQSDSDCKQILSTHCSGNSKKCECDEPFVWNQRESSCVRPKVTTTTESSVPRKESGGFADNLLPPLILAKLLPDYTMMLLIFVVSVVICTLVVLKLTVKCFSSSSSALISPKNKKKKTMNNNLPPRSPYATLSRPNHKPNSQLANFTLATRGRILNYDFEQEGPNMDSVSPQSPQATTMTLGRPTKETKSTSERMGGTMRPPKGHKHPSNEQSSLKNSTVAKAKTVEANDQMVELNDNISISQLESESKSDNSVITIPGPPPAQQPPYMLKTAMRGQGSAIAAAAAAVANKRMQLAQKKNQDQQTTSSKVTNGSPVFL